LLLPKFKILLTWCIVINNVICGNEIRVINNIIEKVSAISDSKFRKDIKIKIIIEKTQKKLTVHSIESDRYRFIYVQVIYS
jgi:hypothetical protein